MLCPGTQHILLWIFQYRNITKYTKTYQGCVFYLANYKTIHIKYAPKTKTLLENFLSRVQVHHVLELTVYHDLLAWRLPTTDVFYGSHDFGVLINRRIG